jgi:glutamate-1-semialdehyde 2,1-aminomutase
MGGMFGYFFAENTVSNFQEALNSDTEIFTRFFQNMLREGIYLPPSAFESHFVSTAHTDEDLEKTAAAFRKALKEV